MDDLLELGALPPGKNAPPQVNRNAEGTSANLIDFENHENKDAPPTPPLNVAAGGAAARTMGSGLLIPARHSPAVSTTGEDEHSKKRSPPPPEPHTSSADHSTVENSGHKEQASPAGEPTALPTDNPADGDDGSKTEAPSSFEPISSSADVPESGEVENKKETSPTGEPTALPTDIPADGDIEDQDKEKMSEHAKAATAAAEVLYPRLRKNFDDMQSWILALRALRLFAALKIELPADIQALVQRLAGVAEAMTVLNQNFVHVYNLVGSCLTFLEETRRKHESFDYATVVRKTAKEEVKALLSGIVKELTALQKSLKDEILAVTAKYLEAINDKQINALVDARVDSELAKRAKADDARDKQLIELKALLKESHADTDRLLNHIKYQAAKPAVAVQTPAPEATAKPDPAMATEMARLKTENESLHNRVETLKTEAERLRTWSEDTIWAVENSVFLEIHNRRAVTNRIIESGFDYDTYDQKAEEPIPAWVSRPRPAGPLFKFSWEIKAAKAAKNGTGDTQPKAPDATKNTKAEPPLTDKMAAQANAKQAPPPPAVNTTKTATPKPAGAVKANAPVVNDTTATQSNGVAPKLVTPINDPSIIGRGRGRHNRGQGRDSRGRGGRGTRGGGVYRG